MKPTNARLAQLAVALRALARHPVVHARLAGHLAEGNGPDVLALVRELTTADAVDEMAVRMVGRLDPEVVLTFRRDGLTWSAPCGDSVTVSLLVRGEFQAAQLEGLLQWMERQGRPRPDDVVLDIGANIGTTTIDLARRGHRVISIEPVPRNTRLLRTNLEANGLTALVDVIEAAVGLEAGWSAFTTTEHHGQGHLTTGPTDLASLQVRTVQLDAVLRAAGVDAGSVAFAWCDVEGAEGLVIESGTSMWASGVPLYAEVIRQHLERFTSLDHFAGLVRAHFDRYLESTSLMEAGAEASPQPIERLDLRERADGDLLLLPPGFVLSR